MDIAGAAAVGRTGWTPRRLGALLGWYDAFLQQSGTVTVVSDRSGNGYDLFPTGGVTFSMTRWNANRPAFRFNPTNYISSSDPGIAGFVTGSNVPVTLMQVIDTTASGARKYMACWQLQPTSGTFETYVETTENFEVDETSGGGGPTGTASAIGRHAFIMSFDGSVLTTYVDGFVDIDHVSFGAVIVASNQFAFGTNAVGANGFNGSLAELVVVPRAISTAEAMAFTEYARSKWGGF